MENDDVDVEEEEEEDDDVEEEDRSQHREAHFVRACAVKMHMDISQEPRSCAEFYRKSSGHQSGDTHFVRSCAIEKHMDTSQFHKGHFAWKFTRKMPNAPDATSIEHQAFALTVRTLECRRAVWGTNRPNPKFQGPQVSDTDT